MDCVNEVVVERALDDAESADGLVGYSILDRNLCEHEVSIKPLSRDFGPQRIAETAPADWCRSNCGPAIRHGSYVVALAQQSPSLTDNEIVDTPGINRKLLGVVAEHHQPDFPNVKLVAESRDDADASDALRRGCSSNSSARASAHQNTQQH